MIEELADLLQDFPGEANRTRCFMHIVNLVAKTLIQQFDIPKAKADDMINKAERELCDLAKDIDIEEMLTENETGPNDTDGDENNNVEGWIDEMELLPTDEREAAWNSIGPIHFLLVKVSYPQFELREHTILTKFNAALQTCFQNYPFHYETPSCLVYYPENMQTQGTHHAARCSHMMELNFWHAGFCPRIPQSHWYD